MMTFLAERALRCAVEDDPQRGTSALSAAIGHQNSPGVAFFGLHIARPHSVRAIVVSGG